LDKIKKIIIAGGGSSGWMTASCLIKNCPDIQITVIDTKTIPIIGVGESTILHINDFLRNLDLADDVWMKYCNATYKLSINYTNWNGDGKTYRYPFSESRWMDKYKPIDWFIKESVMGTNNSSEYCDFAVNTGELMRNNKLVKYSEYIPGWNFDYNTAYHFDAALFAKFLKNEYCIPKGVQHFNDRIIDVEKCEDGSIKSLMTEKSNKMSADLYIDCTGFKSLLLEKSLQEPYISFGDKLINDKAVATHLSYVDKEVELVHNTDAYALSSGWVWNTPLWNSIGTGYVYSSQFLTEEDAEKEFKDYLINERNVVHSRKEVENLTLHHVPIHSGIHERAWVKNVCAIGLSYGFVEPLASTGLMFITRQAQNLVNILKRRKNNAVTGISRSIYNNQVKDMVLQGYEFICAHYAFTERQDSPYWNYLTNELDYSVENIIKDSLFIDVIPKKMCNTYNNWWNTAGRADDFLLFIVAGCGFNPTEHIFTDLVLNNHVGSNTTLLDESTRLNKDIIEYRNKQRNYVKTLQTHYQFLKNTIYKEE